jgi:hypothetical protein
MPPEWFTGMWLRAVIPNGAFDEARVVESPATDWLASPLGGRFDNTSIGTEAAWRAVLLGVHATTSERPGALVSSWYTAAWLRRSISFKLKPDGGYILAQWSPTPSSSVDAVNGAHLELRSTSELWRTDKPVAAHHRCALLLAYIEKYPASFGAALNYQRERYNQRRSYERPSSEPIMADALASNQHRKTTPTLPVSQRIGTVDSRSLPQTAAAELQAYPLVGQEPPGPRAAAALPPRAATSQTGGSVCP